jgi:hypothetical protein
MRRAYGTLCNIAAIRPNVMNTTQCMKFQTLGKIFITYYTIKNLFLEEFMFYHIIIERNEKLGKTGKYETLYEFDNQNLEKIKSDLVLPYKNNNQIIFKGYPLEKKDIRRFAIKRSEKSVDEIRKIQQSKVSQNVLFFWQRSMVVESDELVDDITSDVLKSVEKDNTKNVNIAKKIDMSKIFIVHGHDDSMKIDVASTLIRLKVPV